VEAVELETLEEDVAILLFDKGDRVQLELQHEKKKRSCQVRAMAQRR
jgi:hypothetical protein